MADLRASGRSPRTMGRYTVARCVFASCTAALGLLATGSMLAYAADEPEPAAAALVAPSNQPRAAGPAAQPQDSSDSGSNRSESDGLPAGDERPEVGSEPAATASPRPPAAIDAPSSAEMPSSSPVDEATIRDLDRIRRRVGRSPLAGSLLESVGPGKDSKSLGDSEFARQLRDRFGLPRARSPYSTPAPSQGSSDRRRGETSGQVADGNVMRRRYLESMMRRMEVLAEDLEAVDLGQDAEQIRTVRARLALEMGIE